MSAMTTAIKRACDACHRRKVKCDGINPCRNCSSAQLSCTYNAIPQKKGPKGSRAKVISELRETQRQTSLWAKVQNRLNGVPNAPNSTLAPAQGLLAPEMMRECFEYYFNNMYSIMPILERARLEQLAVYMEHNAEAYCLVTALCAFIVLQPGMTMPPGDLYGLENMPGASIVTSQILMEECFRVRKSYEYLDAPSLNTLCTSYFLFACYYSQELHDKAWCHLRDATTLIQIMDMHQEETYQRYDLIESSRRRRLYWLLFATERAYAVKRSRPVTLQATINLPTVSDDASDPLCHHLNSFLMLVNLYQPFDGALITSWSKTRAGYSQSFLANLAKQLAEAHRNSDPSVNEHDVDRQWLNTMKWHLMANDGRTEAPRLDASEFLPMATPLSQQTVEMLGSPLLVKLFTIVADLINVLAMYPASRDPFALGPHEQLPKLLGLLSVLRSGDHRFLPLLLAKTSELLPKLVNPMCQQAPENHASVDIFDGFGGSSMEQQQMMMEQYEKKYMPQDFSSDSSGSQMGVTPSVHAVNSPFGASPPLVSPGLDFNTPIGTETTFAGLQQSMRHTSFGQQTSQPMMSPAVPQSHSHHHQASMSAMQSLNRHIANMTPSIPSQLSLDHQQQSQSQQQHFGGGMAQQHPLPTVPSLASQQSMSGINSGHARPSLSRTSSFAVPGAGTHQMRTLSDFHALQRANTDMSTLPMGIGVEIDFNALR